MNNMNLKDRLGLMTYSIMILSMFTILLCTKNNFLFSISIAVICTSTGVLLGQLIKRKVQIPKSGLRILLGLFLLSISISLGFYFLVENQYKLTYIVLTNLFFTLGAIAYLWFFKRNTYK